MTVVLRSTSRTTVDVRMACEADDLSIVYGPAVAALPWNRDQVVVAVRAGQLVGAVILWDAGHPVIYVEHWVIVPAARKRLVWARMAQYLDAYGRARGKVALIGTAPDPTYLAMVQRYGATVSTTPTYSITRML